MAQSILPLPDLTFIYGALRSGSTVFRLMLDGHERISNPGEVDFLFDFLHADPGHPTGWRYDIEAMRKNLIFRNRNLELPEGVDGLDLLALMIGGMRPDGAGHLTLNIHRHADKVRKIMPEMKFIHLLRDPRDVAFSSIGMGWTGTSYFGVDHWIRTERQWDAAGIDAANVLLVRFEVLMAEFEPELRRICDFLGVPFDPGMLTYYEGTTFGPPDPKIASQWRRKASDREAALIEYKTGDLLEARDYTPNGASHAPGAMERGILLVTDRVKRWSFSVRRYGLLLFLGARLTRLLGLKSVHGKLRRKQEDIRAAQRQ